MKRKFVVVIEQCFAQEFEIMAEDEKEAKQIAKEYSDEWSREIHGNYEPYYCEMTFMEPYESNSIEI